MMESPLANLGSQHLEPVPGLFEAKTDEFGLCFSWMKTKAQSLAAGQVTQNVQVKSCSAEGRRKDVFISGQVFAGGAGGRCP